jgi:hypothetical protein
MNKSLKSLISSANIMLWAGAATLIIGFISIRAAIGSDAGTGMLFAYLLMVVGGVLVNVGLLAKFLAMASKAVVEGLGGNIKTESALNGNKFVGLTDPSGRI